MTKATEPVMVRCRQHGQGPWCHDMGHQGHVPIRPVLEAIREEVQRRMPRNLREPGGPGENCGEDEELEVRRARAAAMHLLRDWMPRVLALQGPRELAELVNRQPWEWNNAAGRSIEVSRKSNELKAHWLAREMCLKASVAAVTADSGMRRGVPGRRASQRDFIGREIGDAAQALLEAHEEAGLRLDLKRELEILLEKAREDDEE